MSTLPLSLRARLLGFAFFSAAGLFSGTVLRFQIAPGFSPVSAVQEVPNWKESRCSAPQNPDIKHRVLSVLVASRKPRQTPSCPAFPIDDGFSIPPEPTPSGFFEGSTPQVPDASDSRNGLTVGEALYSEDDAMRLAALLAVVEAARRSPEDDSGLPLREVFGRILRDDKSPVMRAVALDALLDVAGTDAWREISAWGLRDSDVHVRSSALLAIQRLFVREAAKDIAADTPSAREKWGPKLATLGEVAVTLQAIEASAEPEMIRAMAHEIEADLREEIARLRN